MGIKIASDNTKPAERVLLTFEAAESDRKDERV